MPVNSRIDATKVDGWCILACDAGKEGAAPGGIPARGDGPAPWGVGAIVPAAAAAAAAAGAAAAAVVAPFAGRGPQLEGLDLGDARLQLLLQKGILICQKLVGSLHQVRIHKVCQSIVCKACCLLQTSSQLSHALLVYRIC